MPPRKDITWKHVFMLGIIAATVCCLTLIPQFVLARQIDQDEIQKASWGGGLTAALTGLAALWKLIR